MVKQMPVLPKSLRVWELIVGTLSYFTAGSLFIMLALTWKLDALAYWILVMLGFMLLICAPVSAILTYWQSTLAIASRILMLGKPTLIIAAFLAAINTVINFIKVFGDQGWQMRFYLWYMLVFFLLFVAAMIVWMVRMIKDPD